MSKTRQRQPSELPEDFIRRIREQFPDSHTDFIAALDRPPRTSIRLNPHKWERIQPKRDLPDDPVPWSVNGRFLKERPSFTLDPLFHAGGYYVQEASSMFLEHVLSRLFLHSEIDNNTGFETAPGVILDACAAPGGKSTLLASLFPEALIIANEVIRSRVPPLMENSIKWGTGNIAVTQNDASHFSSLPGFFDLILADAPCSGEGLFRKHPAARLEWTAENANHCSLRQRSILTDLWPALTPGGYMVYTTCTFNPEENERNVAWLLGETGGECVRIDLADDETHQGWGIHEISGDTVTGYGFYPHLTPGEGFFLSVIRKSRRAQARDHTQAQDRHQSSNHGDAKRQRHSKPGKGHKGANIGFRPRTGGSRPSPVQQAESFAVQKTEGWFTGNIFAWYQIRERLFRIRASHQDTLMHLSGELTVRYAGTEAGRVVRNDVLPAPAAALDIHLKPESFPQIDFTLEEAIRFLRREKLPVPPDANPGWHLAVYDGLPLGWAKNIGSRMNNYYPSEWRIRKTSP